MNRVENFVWSFCPYKSKDIAVALDVMYEAGFDEDTLIEVVKDANVEYAMTLDIVWVAYEHLLQEAHSVLEAAKVSTDIFEVLPIQANYAATSFNAKEGALAKALGLEPKLYGDNLQLVCKIIKKEIQLPIGKEA